MQARPLARPHGFTLIEAMIALFIMSLGIMAVCLMQSSAIKASVSSFNRTEANNLATALDETLQYIPFDDEALKKTGGGSGSLALPASVTGPGMNADISGVHTYETGALSDMLDKLVSVGEPAKGTVIDKAGITYVMTWAVRDIEYKGSVVFKNIHIFLKWNSPHGPAHLDYYTTKYRNIAL